MEEEYQYWEEDEQYQGEQYYEEPQGYSEDWVDADSDGWGITPGIGLFGGCAWSHTTVYDSDGNEVHQESSRTPFFGLGGFLGLW
jgi:hypothetical protein